MAVFKQHLASDARRSSCVTETTLYVSHKEKLSREIVWIFVNFVQF